MDAKTREADLRLDTAEAARTPREGGKVAIAPGKLDESLIWSRMMSSDPDTVMPPPTSNRQLSESEKKTIATWIEQGAPYEKHWSFEPIVAQKDAQSSIDELLALEQKRKGLSAQAPTDAITQVRRLAFTLTGLPPSLSDVEGFVADPSDANYRKLVDQYLASSGFGEEMAKHWLDVARYGDTHGLHLDNERQAWAYRDWVVDAFNANMPFNQFTIEQLAGDLLPNPTQSQLVATGFNRSNVTTSEGGAISDEFLFRYAVDRTDTTMGVWMGLTAGCAVCHDHKFDPVTTKEFYSLYSFFYSAADPAMDGNILLTPPVLQLTTPEQEKTLKDFDAKIAGHLKAVRDAIASLKYVDPATLTPPPPVRTGETVWFEDAFPEKAKVEHSGNPTTFVEASQGPVHSGKRALKRTAKGVAQDFFAKGASFEIPANGVISVWTYLDPADLPKSIMLQFHVGGWNHRAFWGEEGAIPFGKVRTPEKVNMGKLPEAGKWTQLKIDIAKLGLKPGMKVDGFAFTQFDGTVFWDRLAISHRIDEAKDIQWSFKLWSEKKQGSRVAELPGDLQTLVRGKKAVEWSVPERKRLLDWWLENEFQGGREQLDGLRAAKLAEESRKKALNDMIPATLVMAELPQLRQANVMIRGQYDKPGEAVSRGVPAAFHPLPKKDTYDRRDLAAWLLSPANPLTTRVTVNRYWQQFFGYGLVKTSGDFGSQGDSPSHPELLDWLAVEFRESGWDMKRLVRLLVSSAAYRRSAAVSPELLTKDPENRLLARGPRHRLDAEVIRDQALFVSGLLSPRIGGKGVRPYQPDGVWEPVGFTGSNTARYARDTGEALYRRSLYTFWKRTAPPPSMIAFDAPAREASCVRRELSNTPLQALALLNDVQHVEAARAFAQRILKEGGATDEAKAAFAWLTAVGRRPASSETQVTLDALRAHRARYAAQPADATKLITFGESKPDASLPAPEVAAWTLTASLLLNLDETLNR